MKCVADISTWSERSSNATNKRYASVQLAVSDLLAHHSYALARDGAGNAVTAATGDSQYASKAGVVAVVWKSQADATKGDLTKALAVIRPR